MTLQFYKHIELDTDLKEIESVLKANNMQYEVSSAGPIIDSVIVGNGMFAKYTLKLMPSDFEKANALLKQLTEEKSIQIEDYKHLTALTNDELLEILAKPEEWSLESESVAKKILQSRDYTVTDTALQQLRKAHAIEVKKRESTPIVTQLIYVLLILACLFLGYVFIVGK